MQNEVYKMRLVVVSVMVLVVLSMAVFAIPPPPDKPTFSLSSGGDLNYASHCSNGVQDDDEKGKDCGGSCTPCGSGFNWLYVIIPGAFIVIAAIVMIMMRGRSSAPQQPMRRQQYAPRQPMQRGPQQGYRRQ